MTDSKQDSSSVSEIEQQLQAHASGLKAALDNGDLNSAMHTIAELGEVRDRSLYREVGRLTRSLHEALRDFEIDPGTSEQREELSKMADASDRLDYVVKMTGRSANKTMDLVEDTMPMTAELKSQAEALRTDWGRLRRREMKPSEFRELYRRMDGFLDRVCTDSDRVHHNLSEILLAQDYQDLTGQVIQKVTNLVREVEDNLVRLMVMASDVDRIAGVVHDFEQPEKSQDKGEGPQVNAEKQKEEVVANQDEVDDLLSSLGF